MIQVFYGDDTLLKRRAIEKSTASFLKQYPESSVLLVSTDQVDDLIVSEFIYGASLFGDRSIIVFGGILEHKEKGGFVLGKIKDMQESPNLFILEETELTKDTSKSLKDFNIESEQYKLATIKKERFNVFALSDALVMRDKKALWVLYRKAIDSGLSAEEIVPILIWQVKNMFLVKDKKADASFLKESGLSPFVAKKAESGSKKFTHEELSKLSFNLVSLYHDARRGHDLEIGLERLILEIA